MRFSPFFRVFASHVMAFVSTFPRGTVDVRQSKLNRSSSPRCQNTKKVANHAAPLRMATAQPRPQQLHSQGIPAVSKGQPSFDWLNQWYPIYFEADVEKNKPYPITIWNKRLVLFQRLVPSTNYAQSRYVVLDDRCSHRSAPLSEGRVVTLRRSNDTPEETVLECGYHGWTFNCQGKCIQIPTLPLDGPVQSNAHLPSPYPVHVSAGIIFVWPGDADPNQSGRPAPFIPDDFLADDARLVQYRREFPCDAVTVMENVADSAHGPWTHHGIVERRENVPRNGGVQLTSVDMLNGIISAQVFNDTASYSQVTFRGPTLVDAKIQNGPIEVRTAFWATPTTPHKCVLYNVAVFIKAPNAIRFIAQIRPRWASCLGGHKFADGDAPLLYKQFAHLCDRNVDGAVDAWTKEYGLAYAHWDSLVLSIRNFFLMHDETMPQSWKTQRQISSVPLLRMDQLLDRYHSHTVHCTACTRALKQTRYIALLAKLIAAAASVVLVCGALVAIVVSTSVTGLAAGAGAQAISMIAVIASTGIAVLLLAVFLVKLMARRESLFLYSTEDYERTRKE